MKTKSAGTQTATFKDVITNEKVPQKHGQTKKQNNISNVQQKAIEYPLIQNGFEGSSRNQQSQREKPKKSNSGIDHIHVIS